MPGPRRLVDWPWVALQVECEPCRYGATYRIVRLAEKYGAEAELAGLLDRVRAKCRAIDRGHRRHEPSMACPVRYRVPAGGPLPEGAAAREAVPGETWPPRPTHLGPAEPLPTIGGARRHGITHVNLHCCGTNREGATCHHTADVPLDALGLPDGAVFRDIAQLAHLVCRRCGNRQPSVMACWPDPREVQARRGVGGGPLMRERNGIVVPLYKDAPTFRPAPEIAAVPSMPELSVYEVVEDEDGAFAVIWASTGRVIVWNGRAQRGLTVDEADDVADHLEALDRIAVARGGRVDG